VALFDSVPPGAYVRSFRKAIADLSQQVVDGRAVDTLKDLLGRAYARVAASVPLDLTRLPLGTASRQQSVQGQAFRKMTAAYDPSGKRYFLNVLLIKATQKTLGIGARLKHDYGFDEMIVGRLEVAEVDADHRGLLDGAPVARVYQLLSDYLEANDPMSSGVVSISPWADAGLAQNQQAGGGGRHVDPTPRQRSGS
jgi:hypothetical protein